MSNLKNIMDPNFKLINNITNNIIAIANNISTLIHNNQKKTEQIIQQYNIKIDAANDAKVKAETEANKIHDEIKMSNTKITEKDKLNEEIIGAYNNAIKSNEAISKELEIELDDYKTAIKNLAINIKAQEDKLKQSGFFSRLRRVGGFKKSKNRKRSRKR